MYRNNILNFQVSTTIINAHMKKVVKLIYICIYIMHKKDEGYGPNCLWTLTKWLVFANGP